jgi:hypothetical protein
MQGSRGPEGLRSIDWHGRVAPRGGGSPRASDANWPGRVVRRLLRTVWRDPNAPLGGLHSRRPNVAGENGHASNPTRSASCILLRRLERRPAARTRLDSTRAPDTLNEGRQ